MARHPTDELGRVLPASDWPAHRPAPGRLELLRRLCNSTNVENGADRLTTPVRLDRWLIEQGEAPVTTGPRGLALVVQLRELVRAAAAAHGAGREDHAPVAAIAAVAGDVRLAVTAETGLLTVRPTAARAVERLAGEIALAVAGAQAAGTWPRLKACHCCSWVFYDTSKNRSGRWCSMTACGGRQKMRAYRRRRAAR